MFVVCLKNDRLSLGERLDNLIGRELSEDLGYAHLGLNCADQQAANTLVLMLGKYSELLEMPRVKLDAVSECGIAHLAILRAELGAG